MKVTKNILQQHGLLDSLPAHFHETKGGEFFVFYYLVNEEQAVLNVYETLIAIRLNKSLYRGLLDKAKIYGISTQATVGYFANEDYDTRDGLFYLFLKTYNSEDAVSKFYEYARSEDEKADASISTNAVNDIETRADFGEIIGHFSRVNFQEIMSAYDMVDAVLRKKTGKSLFGGYISKVVTMLKHSNGVMPELQNSNIRYMVIGENAQLSDMQRELLFDAKMMARSEVPLSTIYLKTGWAFEQKDGKWRTNISDTDAGLITDRFSWQTGGNLFGKGANLYIPDGMDVAAVVECISDTTKIRTEKYIGRLARVLKHPTIYDYYPFLLGMPLLYCFRPKEERGLINNFYYSDNSHICITGGAEYGNSLSIMLHETQHAIQLHEGFATGGNLFFAKFVASIGSSDVRKVFTSINLFRKTLKGIISADIKEDICRLIKDTYARANNGDQEWMIKTQLLKSCSMSYADFMEDFDSIAFLLCLFLGMQSDKSQSFEANSIYSYFKEKVVGLEDVIDTIKIGYEAASDVQDKLVTEGYSREDVENVLFISYLNLYGELESRSVQASRMVSMDKNYFYMAGWELTPDRHITIIDGVEYLHDTDKIKAAVEEKEGKYILHFERGYESEPFIHELGHIVFDLLGVCGVDYKGEDESFVKDFLRYMRKHFGIKLNNHSNEPSKLVEDALDMFFKDADMEKRKAFVMIMNDETPFIQKPLLVW